MAAAVHARCAAVPTPRRLESVPPLRIAIHPTMSRLQRELCRLYAPQADAGPDTDLDASGLIDSSGRVRAMVLGLARPADWLPLAKAWQGVQVDLELPAPAIAVSGTDGHQLWFSLAEPVPAAQAAAFLDALRLRYMGDIAARRVDMLPALDDLSPSPASPASPPSQATPVRHARLVPAAQTPDGPWSAFVAADLAPVFTESPWLDLPPNPDGQAKLLAGLKTMPAADFELAMDRLRHAQKPADAPTDPPSAREVAAVAAAELSVAPARAATARGPRRFLLDVMNDDSIALGLRIEAAKALLHQLDDRGCE